MTAMNDKHLYRIDLEEGKYIDSELALDHPKKKPQKIIYAICKLTIESENHKAFSSKEIQEEAFGELLEQKEGKTNPVDHFSQALTMKKYPKESEGVFERWATILDRRRPSNSKYYYYSIKKSKVKDVEKLLEEIREN